MICTNGQKREVSGLALYRKSGESVEFFLQKRSRDHINPGRYGLFGGGVEDQESPEGAMLREIKEELGFTPSGYIFFSRYEFAHMIDHVFALEVAPGFEDTVTVLEGEYGKFLTLEEIEESKDVSTGAKLIMKQLGEHLLHKVK
jgi:8-oxo-dGTP pyrophosphatase MutT (NUDIX family)